MNLKQLLDSYQQKSDRLKTLTEKLNGEGLSVEEVAEARTLNDDLNKLATDIETARELAKASAAASAKAAEFAVPVIAAPVPVEAKGSAVPPAGYDVHHKAPLPIPAEAARLHTKIFKTNEEAYGFGCFVAALRGNGQAAAWCKSNGVHISRGPEMKAQTEGVDTAGGYLVPVQYSSTMIRLREKYGVVRRLFRSWDMASETLLVPRSTSDVTIYAIGETEAITASDAGFDQVQLNAKKFGGLTRASNELFADAQFIALGDFVMESMSYSFAKREDELGLTATGTANDHGIKGIIPRLLEIYGTSGLGLRDGTGATWASLVLDDFTQTTGLLPDYAHADASWVCSRKFYNSVMLPIKLSSGGTTAAEVTAGSPETFLGYPVNISQAMPVAEATGQIPVLFGDYKRAAAFGDRQMVEFAMNTSVYFVTDETAIRGLERIDINVHDAGLASAAGPVVGLYNG